MLRISQNKDLVQFDKSIGGITNLNPSGDEFTVNSVLTLPIILEPYNRLFKACKIKLQSNISMNFVSQNLANDSDIPVYFNLVYWVTSGQYKGKWLIGNRTDFIPPIINSENPLPNPFYDGIDPNLQNLFELVSGGGNHFFATEIDLKNRKTYREEPYNNEELIPGIFEKFGDYLICIDSSQLFYEPGYLVLKPYHSVSDSRTAYGSGVSSLNVFNLFILVAFNFYGSISYR